VAPIHVQKQPQGVDDGAPSGTMGFLEHLDELRTRIIRSCIALAIGMLIAFAFIGRIADFVLGPTLRLLPPGASLIMTRFGEGLSFYMDLALLGGVVVAAPFVTYQVWCFIAPGLYAKEKRLVLPFIILATCGTLAGALFSHYVLFPSMVAFFGTFDSPRMRLMPRVEDTFDLYKNMLIGMMAVFQIPTLVLFLARLQRLGSRGAPARADGGVIGEQVRAPVGPGTLTRSRDSQDSAWNCRTGSTLRPRTEKHRRLNEQRW